MDNITWLDALRAAVPSCQSCFAHDADDDELRQGEPTGHLRSLLSSDGDTVSLHSNIGQGRKRKLKKREKKSVTLFGFSLFGAREGAIRLEDEEDSSERQRTTSHSSYGYESDAHVLAQETIAKVAAEEKLERRRKRRERKEKRRIARALAAGDQDEFEGFQGSGGHQTYAPTSNPLSSTSSSTRQSDRSTADDDDDDADLDAALYVGSRPVGSGSSARSSTTGSSRHQHSSHLLPPHRRTSSHSQSQSSAESQSLASPPPTDLHLFTTGLQKQDDTRFPSPGFGRGYSAGRGGAFLAHTGANDDEHGDL